MPHESPPGPRNVPSSRVRLSRAEQRFNYGLAIGAVLVVVLLIVVSPKVSVGGQELPVFISALLLGAFLFGLGQMAIGISRRRRYLRSLQHPDDPAGD